MVTTFTINGLENVKSLGTTTLSSSISASDTSISVASATNITTWPTANFAVRVDNEIIFITSRSSNTLTVHASGRGYAGTTAASHAANATIKHVHSSVALAAISEWLDAVSGGASAAVGSFAIGTKFLVQTDGNVGIATATFGTSAAKVIAIGSGTAPTTSPADAVQMWVADGSGGAGFASLFIRSENGGEFHIGGDGGAIRGQSTTADATNKRMIISTAHYTNSEEPFVFMRMDSLAAANEIDIGGGLGTYNTATRIGFFTAANNTTVTGTERVRVPSDGGIAIQDAIAAPATVTGFAVIYVDSADGDLKVKFADGFVRVIAADS